LSLHTPFAPHCESMTHVPHVPPTHAPPPPHWLFAVQSLQTPAMQARPGGAKPGSDSPVLQSRNVEQAPHTPATHAWPDPQSAGDWQTPHSPKSAMQPSPASHSVAPEHLHSPASHTPPGPHWVPDVHCPHTPSVHTCPRLQSVFALHADVQTPAAHASPVAQSVLAVHVHSTVVWVAVHCAAEPHCAFVVHSPHSPAEQTCPAAHWAFDAQEPVPVAALGTQTSTDSHIPPIGPPTRQNAPSPQSAFVAHWSGPNLLITPHVSPVGHVVHA
jgi:hypothetical protein